MARKTIVILALLLSMSLLLRPGLALAGATPGSGPAEATGPGDDWVLLPVGGAHWYAFDFSGHHEMVEYEEEDDEDEDEDDEEEEEDDEDEDEEVEEQYVWFDSPVDVLLDAEPDKGAAFSILNEEQVRLWSLGKEYEPVGRGTVNELKPGDLFWSGGLGRPGRYYVLVEHQGTESSRYLIGIEGEDISFPGTSGGATWTPAEGEGAEAERKPGSGPYNTMAPSEDWVAVGTGETQWYAFDYLDSLPAEVLLDAQPDGSIAFSIWTEEHVRLWALGEEFEPVGRGTENDLQPGDLFWSGRLGRPGRYYVLAQQQGPVPGTYKLQIVGAEVASQ